MVLPVIVVFVCITKDPLDEFNLRSPVEVSKVLSSVCAILILPNVAPAATIVVNVVFPSTNKSPPILVSPPTYKFLSMPTPPSTITEPVLVFVDCVVSKILNLPERERVSLTLTSLLNVTGPSNCDNISPESPPSTIILSLIVTSSKTALNLAGSSPVTVGIGVSNEVSSPVAEDFLVLPI